MTFIMDEDLTSVYFEDINTEVHGFSYHTAEIKSPLLEDIQVPLNSRIQILMAHGGDAAHLPINSTAWSCPHFPTLPWDISTNLMSWRTERLLTAALPNLWT